MRKAWIGAICALATFGLVPGEPLVLLDAAHAIVGRPATPVSVAGVARRTTRRTVAATSAVVVASPQQCTQRYDSYGRLVTTCY